MYVYARGGGGVAGARALTFGGRKAGVLMAAGNYGAQVILNTKGKQKGIIYKKVWACTTA